MRYGGHQTFQALFKKAYGNDYSPVAAAATVDAIASALKVHLGPVGVDGKQASLTYLDDEVAAAVAELAIATYAPSLWLSDAIMAYVAESPIVHIPTLGGAPCLASDSIRAILATNHPVGAHLNITMAQLVENPSPTAFYKHTTLVQCTWTAQTSEYQSSPPTEVYQLMAGTTSTDWVQGSLDPSCLGAVRC